MRGLIILFISAVAMAVPQGYMYPLNQPHHQPMIGRQEANVSLGDVQLLQTSNTIQELPEILQKQPFSVELPLAQDLSPPLEQFPHFRPQMMILPVAEEHVPLPLTTYGVVPPAPQPIQNEVVISKQFFLHSAPEEDDEEVQEKVLTIGKPRRNYNVIFIRAPVKAQRTASIKLIPAINEDKTIVYVLSKKTEAADINAHIEELPTTTTKPEVYFIRYKTPEEANHAQEKIQAEYERLGGSTQVSNEGISPVSSVIGSLEEKTAQEQPTTETPTAATPSENVSAEELVAIPTNNGYLPPNYYYRF